MPRSGFHKFRRERERERERPHSTHCKERVREGIEEKYSELRREIYEHVNLTCVWVNGRHQRSLVYMEHHPRKLVSVEWSCGQKNECWSLWQSKKNWVKKWWRGGAVCEIKK